MKEEIMMIADIVLNALIFAVTAVICVGFFRKDGRWDMGRCRAAFRFFTVQSNVLCGLAAGLMLLWPASRAVWVLKYLGTAAVTVTMATVFVFLAPTMGGLKPLLAGSSLFLHLLTPLTAIASFILLERRGMDFGTAMLGMLPVVCYGPLYLYRIRFCPEAKRWDDFYGFNRGGRWPVAYAAMALGTFGICMGLMALQNIA